MHVKNAFYMNILIQLACSTELACRTLHTLAMWCGVPDGPGVLVGQMDFDWPWWCTPKCWKFPWVLLLFDKRKV